MSMAKAPECPWCEKSRQDDREVCTACGRDLVDLERLRPAFTAGATER
jgi:hypothetical protein